MDLSKISVDEVLAAVEADDLLGFCVKCGAEAYNVEPDACAYRCESCGAPHGVYGAQELLLHMVA